MGADGAFFHDRSTKFMFDMLVKLYDLPPLAPEIARQESAGITLRRGLAPEKHVVLAWVGQHFDAGWVSECDIAFSRQPVACWIAVRDAAVIGFACYDATAKGLFGPTGVSEAARGQGTGRALLVACLHDMRAQGYAYAVIGGVGPAEFYAKVAGAVPIAGSEDGVYRGLLGA
jgi:GNAT superfamily N-acetyltransferase